MPETPYPENEHDRLPCTNGCVINSLVGGDHAYCECHCHAGTIPAIQPSRERLAAQTEDEVVDGSPHDIGS